MTQVLFKFTHPDGSPHADTSFKVVLSKAGFREADANGIILPETIIGVTDADGQATLDLAPLMQPYHLYLPTLEVSEDEDNCRRYRFVVPEVAGVVEVETLIITDPTWSKPWDEVALEVIITAKAEAQTAANEARASEISATSSASAAHASNMQAADYATQAQNSSNAANQSMLGAAEQEGLAKGHAIQAGEYAAQAEAAVGQVVDKQPTNAKLTAISASVWSANQVMIATGADSLSMLTTGTAGRAIMSHADAAAVKTYLALNNVNNTADLDKPISTPTQNALNLKMRNATTNVVDSTSDLNTLNQAGPHTAIVGSGNPNMPEAALFYLFNFVYFSGSWCQVLFPYGVANSGYIWYRTFYSGNSQPTAWRRVLASSDLVTAITDVTAGRILTVGFMGLGGSSVIGGTINTLSVTGFYGYSVSNVVPGHTYFNLLNIRWGGDGNWATQLVMGVGNNEIAYRAAHTSAANSSPWARILTSRNATLPVTLDLHTSGGLMEFGNNSNGSYWKFANGLLVNLHTYKVGYTADTLATFQHPHAFLAGTLPATSCSVVASNAWDATVAHYGTESACYFHSEQSFPNNGIQMMAIGRWF